MGDTNIVDRSTLDYELKCLRCGITIKEVVHMNWLKQKEVRWK